MGIAEQYHRDGYVIVRGVVVTDMVVQALQPGDVSIHHPNIVHGSNANNSADQWRIHLVIRVISSHTRVTDPDWKGVYHLRGARHEDLNRYLPVPVAQTPSS